MPSLAAAEAFPERPMRMIVPSAPGGSLDMLARAISRKLGEMRGWSMVVENRSGGGGSIGMDAVAKARPDGYTLLIASEPLTVNPSVMPNLPFDPVRDLAPLTLVATLSQVLAVGRDSPLRSFADFIAAATGGRDITIGHSGATSPGRMTTALLELAGVKVTPVTYRGGGHAVQDAVAGTLDGTIVTLPATLPFLADGSLRALAITSAARSPFVPEVPTMSETLPEVIVNSWQALFVPSGVPADIMTRLHSAITAAIRSPELDKLLKDQAFEPVAGPPEELGAMVLEEIPKWRRVVQQTGMRVD
ncbi:tripartite tricarboxylate transporter substrate binding protein [Roseomonas hellenica]|uniref:Tripartite tricarboxylate transporter substrate binding protein n=1 Tax=Plastoroseomonas hellenica TaxID=2687306 RepID=A0ABS5F4Q6_9PROT|nr:tripartite tricarboxylate transporter substrate-binding protein [Plastoroseomonas hellenica]MBR0667566.1 tripartite tricarboxylate transporter substrate binding protein [Plastoroseomonas hellenica]